MKKVFSTLCVAVILIAALGSCNGKPPESDQNADTKGQATTPQDPAAEPSESTLDADEPVGIVGSHITDIRLGLSETYGIPEGGIGDPPSTYTGGGLYSKSLYTDDGLQVAYEYTLHCDKDFQLTDGNFIVMNVGAGDELTTTMATQLLSYCASIPYDSADSAGAQQWVRDNISASETEQTTTIGDAIFTLSLTKINDEIAFYELSIKKVAA